MQRLFVKRFLVVACIVILFLLSSLVSPPMAFARFSVGPATQLTVVRALTAQNNQEKTTFNPGDPIWYAVIVQNSGPPISVEVTWQATDLIDPNDSSKFTREIFFDKNTVTVQTGAYTLYSPSTVPSNAAGPYWNKETVTVNGQTMAVQSQFTIHTPLQENSSPIWSGYVVQGATGNQVIYTEVKGSWTVPLALCSQGETARSAIWVGIGGIEGDHYLEQVGTTADCNNGVSDYYSWYEMFPTNPVRMATVYPGDHIDARVSVFDQNNGAFDLRIGDNNTHPGLWVVTGYRQGAELNSAEWIVENKHDAVCSTSSTNCPLTHFVTNSTDTIQFSACSANGHPITANPLLRSFAITDTGNADGKLKAFPLHTTDSDTAFRVQWVRS